VSVYHVNEYRRLSDDLWKWFLLPPWQAAGGEARRQAAFEREAAAQAGVNPLMVLIPAVGRARNNLNRLDRTAAALQAVEALRAYAEAHDGQWPAALDDIEDTPVPADPGTGKPFAYRVDGGTAVIEVPALAGDPAHTGARYELTARGR
jgi:hypothetical protein